MARLTMLRPRVGTLRTGAAAAVLEVERTRGRPWQRLRAQVLSADPLCVHCRRDGRVSEATEVDHVVPLWAGGTDALANLQGLCAECHAVKSAGEARERVHHKGEGGLNVWGAPSGHRMSPHPDLFFSPPPKPGTDE